MRFCPQCGKQLNDEALFCTGCGTKLAPKVPTPTPAPVPEPVPEPIPTPVDDPVPESVPESSEEKPKKGNGKKLNPKLIGALIAAVAVVAVAVIAVILLSGGKSKKGTNDFIYSKDNSLMLSAPGKKEPFEVTDELYSDDVDEEERYDTSALYHIKENEDGKILFYPEDYSRDSYTFTLYYIEQTKKNAQPVKIASDVRVYYVNSDCTVVTFSCNNGDTSTLSQYDMKKGEKKKIANDLGSFEVDKNGNNIVYENDDSLYYYDRTKDSKEKLESDISNFTVSTENMNKIYFTKDEKLYVTDKEGNKTKIDSEVTGFEIVGDSLLYKKSDESGKTYLDFVNDTKKESDENMTRPVSPSYPSFWDADYEAKYEQYQKDYADYETKLEEYYAKESRDEIRETLSEELYFGSLYCYDGTKSVLLTDYYDSYLNNNLTYSYEYYVKANFDSIEKVALDEEKDAYDIEEEIKEAIEEASTFCIYYDGKAIETDIVGASVLTVDSDKGIVYYCTDIDEDTDSGELYKLSVSGGKASKPEHMASDVYCDNLGRLPVISKNGSILYMTNVDTDDETLSCELYLDDKKIADDAEPLAFCDDGRIMYVTDIHSSEDKFSDTLMEYKNGKSTTIAEDVLFADYLPNGEMIYISDYSINNYSGDLYTRKGNKAALVDSDVTNFYVLG